MANKPKTGGLNNTTAITFGMPAGRGRKGETPPRSRRGKQSTSVVVPRNPNQSQTYPDGYIIYIPHQDSQVLALTKYSWVRSTQLCIFHQAFLPYSIRVNISSSPAKRAFSSCIHSAAIFVIPTIGSSRNGSGTQAAFVLPSDNDNNC